MLKKIRLNYGNKGWVTQWAWVVGNLALHPSVNWKFPDGRRCYTVTHIPTGTAVFDKLDTKKMALRGLKEAQGIRWKGLSPFDDLPTCELVNVAPLFIAEYSGAEYAKEWVRDCQMQIADALACEVSDESKE